MAAGAGRACVAFARGMKETATNERHNDGTDVVVETEIESSACQSNMTLQAKLKQTVSDQLNHVTPINRIGWQS